MSPAVVQSSGEGRVEDREKEHSRKGSLMCCLGATQLTLESVHVAQVDLGDRECAHVACKNELAAVVQVLLLDTRKPFNH